MLKMKSHFFNNFSKVACETAPSCSVAFKNNGANFFGTALAVFFLLLAIFVIISINVGIIALIFIANLIIILINKIIKKSKIVGLPI